MPPAGWELKLQLRFYFIFMISALEAVLFSPLPLPFFLGNTGLIWCLWGTACASLWRQHVSGNISKLQLWNMWGEFFWFVPRTHSFPRRHEGARGESAFLSLPSPRGLLQQKGTNHSQENYSDLLPGTLMFTPNAYFPPAGMVPMERALWWMVAIGHFFFCLQTYNPHMLLPGFSICITSKCRTMAEDDSWTC